MLCAHIAIACARGSEPLRVYVADGGSRGERAGDLLREAAHMWDDGCGVYVSVVPVESHESDDVPVYVLTPPIACPVSGATCAGLTRFRGSSALDIQIADLSDDWLVRRTMAHEIGHALGIDHVEGTIMSAGTIASQSMPSSVCDQIDAHYK